MDASTLAEDSAFDLTLKVDSSSDIDDRARDNRCTLIRAYEALLKGDNDAWWRCFDPEVKFYEAEGLPYGQSVKGLAVAQQGMGDMFATWKRVDVTIEQFVAAGDLVIAYISMKAVSRKTGKVYEGPVAELFRFRDGKIVEWRPIYWDTYQVRQVCGVP